MDWSIRIAVNGTANEGQLDELMDKLEPFGAVVTGTGEDGTFGIRLAIEADTLAHAVSEALTIVKQNLRFAKIPFTKIEAHEAVPLEQLIAENRGEGGETLVGLSDIARKHDFSRQRALELSKLPGFPRPVATVAGGRIWRFIDVERFLARERRPGRPRKETGAVVDLMEALKRSVDSSPDRTAATKPPTKRRAATAAYRKRARRP